MGLADVFTLNGLNYVGQTAAAAGTCSFAWAKGGRAEKMAGVVFAIGWEGLLLSTVISVLLTGDPRPPFLYAVIWDVLPAAVLLYLALRYDNLWLGAAVVAQGAQLALWGVDLTLREKIGTPVQFSLGLTMNLLNLVMMAMIIGSTLSSTRRRSRTDADVRAR